MGLFSGRRRPDLPDAVRAAVPLGKGEAVLAGAHDETSDGWVVATTYAIAFVGRDGALAWKRPWHEAQSGTWQSDSDLLTVLWVDGLHPAQWQVHDPSKLHQVVRERIQASVILTDEFRTANRKTVRVVLRQDHATGDVVEQVVAPRGIALTDPEVSAEATRRLAGLRDQIGR